MEICCQRLLETTLVNVRAELLLPLFTTKIRLVPLSVKARRTLSWPTTLAKSKIRAPLPGEAGLIQTPAENPPVKLLSPDVPSCT